MQGGGERPAAEARGYFPPFEVAEEFLPFGVAGGAVFLSRAQSAAGGPGTPSGC